MAKQDDGLFLLEVLVDKIIFIKSPCFSDKDFRTCVNIQAPSVEPLEICDDDPGACVANSGGPFVKSFNNGKSCLFSLKESDISKAMSSFPIKISVYKSLPCGCLPTKIVMGEATIDMTKEFVEARKKFLEDPNTVSYQALKDSFRIVGTDGAQNGEILMFLRISCFGKLIITRFQGAGGPPKLGAGGSSAIVDRSCNPRRDFQSSYDPCACGTGRSAGAGTTATGAPPCLALGGGGGAPCPIMQDPYDSMPCADPDDPCYCSGPKPARKPPMVCRNTDQYCLHVPKGRTKQFEEIGTTLGGNELKIKVPASASIIKKISQTHCSMQSPYDNGKQGDRGQCDPPCGKNQISLALPSEAICCAGAQPAKTQFTCVTEGCSSISKHGPQNTFGKGDVIRPEPPNKNSFVLKVAKTAVQGDRKLKFEVELTTPKGPDKQLPVRKVNTRMQSDPDCDCCIPRLKKPKEKKHSCPPGNKVIFQLPMDSCAAGHKQRAYFNFTSDGVGDVARDEPGQLVSATSEDYQGVIYDFPPQVIKIRIGKTVEMANRKSKMEYQFITPVVTHEKVVPVTDTRTAQCMPTCDCCPGGLPRLPLCQDSYEARRLEIVPSCQIVKQDSEKCSGENMTLAFKDSQANFIVTQCLRSLVNELIFSITNREFVSAEPLHYLHSGILRSETLTVYADSINDGDISKNNIFNKKETAVYMTLIDDFCYRITSGTQATASVNKCLQVSKDRPYKIKYLRSTPSTFGTKSDLLSSTTMSTQSYRGVLRNSDVYFFGRKKDTAKSGMEKTDSDTNQNKPCRSPECPGSPRRITRTAAGISVQANCSTSCSAWAQTHQAVGSSAATNTSKSVCIRDDREPCPVVCAKAEDLSAMVSHIRIGPPQLCPVHGPEPCSGPNCTLATSAENERAPVKVSTVTNPRRGVFELVIRRLTGAPLARNELMLEWTPPPPRLSSCSSPCSTPCTFVPSCRPTKCKMIVCRPSPCKPKSCKRPCKKPCRSPCYTPCRTPCYSPSGSLCGSPCRSSCRKPCRRPCRSPCPKPCRSPCRTPCYKPCRSPCRTPCYKPCRSPCQTPCDKPCHSPCPSPCYRRCRSPCRPKPCRSPCRSSCRRRSPCRVPRRPSPCCAPCRVPRRPSPFRSKCRPAPCRKVCKSPCDKLSTMCSPCTPCPTYIQSCRPALPCGQPCATPCCDSVPCSAPCSSPCLQLCPVGRRKPRRCRSQPRMKPHKKRISPCRNRSRYCPVPRCRSVPGPCVVCCAPVTCPPRKCCSGFPYKPTCCKSTCSSCCA